MNGLPFSVPFLECPHYSLGFAVSLPRLRSPSGTTWSMAGVKCSFQDTSRRPVISFCHGPPLNGARLVDQTIAQFAETCPVSIVHAHTGSVSSWAALQAAKRYKIPCVVTYHGSEVHTVLARRQKGWKLCRDSFKAADLNLPVGRSLETILRNSVQPTGRCETLLLGVDRHRFFPAVELSLEPQVLYVGRIERAKGVYDLLQAWVRVLVHCPNARLTMVGEDRTDGLFSQQARSLGVSESISSEGTPARSSGCRYDASISCLLLAQSQRGYSCVCDGSSVVRSPRCSNPCGRNSRHRRAWDNRALSREGRHRWAGCCPDYAASRSLHMCSHGKGAHRTLPILISTSGRTANRLVDLYHETIAAHSTTHGVTSRPHEWLICRRKHYGLNLSWSRCPLKICHVCNGHTVDDGRVFHRACCALAKAGYEVHLLAQGSGTKTYEEKGVIIHPLPECGSKNGSGTARASLVAQLAADLKPDLFHVHEPDLLGPVIARAGSRPVIYDVHESYLDMLNESDVAAVLGKTFCKNGLGSMGTPARAALRRSCGRHGADREAVLESA